jgi:Alcohol dehydrogenase GroES-like domain
VIRNDVVNGIAQFDRLASLFKHFAAGVRQPHVSRRTLQESNAELVLEVGDATTDGRKGHFEPARGFRKAVCVHDSGENFQRIKVSHLLFQIWECNSTFLLLVDNMAIAYVLTSMKAIVVSQYGGPEVMEYKDFPDPVPGPDEVLVRVAATSVNPIDLKRRSGEAKAFLPITFPGILGVDVAGTVISSGSAVEGFQAGDHVFGMADQTYAELCVAKAENLAKIPKGLDPVEAAALPLVTTTGFQLIRNGAVVHREQTLLVTGALGNVGRSAVYTAKSLGAKVIERHRKHLPPSGPDC